MYGVETSTQLYLGHEALSQSDDFDQKDRITRGVWSDVTHDWEDLGVQGTVRGHLLYIPYQVFVSRQFALENFLG